eukprot:TRINITY_DN2010_c0_g1_i2.p1 TRINITY_DN2010_c0_g1~~TRINITY_DN2010_c0_g1_i2.p1  ORF type:complete len:336 (+),score=94.16 TRINITY_DN2010_c0_g1_i2:154-1161(+)
MADAEQLDDQQWFFGNLDRASAEAVLVASGPGTFIVRGSSVPDSYALSLHAPSYAVPDPDTAPGAGLTHTLITRDRTGAGWRLQRSSRTYASVVQLVKDCPELSGFQPARRAEVAEARLLPPASSHKRQQPPPPPPPATAGAADAAAAGAADGQRRAQPAGPARVAPASSPPPPPSELSVPAPPSAAAAAAVAEPLVDDAEQHGARRAGASVDAAAATTAAAADELDALLHRLLLDVNSHNIGKVKESLKILIDDQSTKLQEFDRAVVQQSLRAKTNITLPSKDSAGNYQRHLDNIDKLRNELQKLRLRGDEFRIVHKGDNKLFKISADSIVCCH